MARHETDPDDPTLEELEEAARRLPRQALPLEYASRLKTAPFDWAGAIRQTVFAAGVGFIAGAVADLWAYPNGWRDNEVMWIGFGAAMVALALPWPGRVGRRRH